MWEDSIHLPVLVPMEIVPIYTGIMLIVFGIVVLCYRGRDLLSLRRLLWLWRELSRLVHINHLL